MAIISVRFRKGEMRGKPKREKEAIQVSKAQVSNANTWNCRPLNLDPSFRCTSDKGREYDTNLKNGLLRFLNPNASKKVQRCARLKVSYYYDTICFTPINVRNGARLWTTLSKVSTGQEPEVPTDKVSGVEASRFGIESNQVESCGLGINIRGFPRLIVRKALLSWFQCAGS